MATHAGKMRWHLNCRSLQSTIHSETLEKVTNVPEGFKKIRVHFVFAVKHDGCHKARLVAGGHLTDVPLDSVYSGVVSLRSLRLVIFLAELNGLELFSADVGNAYLEAKTKEKVYIIAGDGFGDLKGSYTRYPQGTIWAPYIWASLA